MKRYFLFLVVITAICATTDAAAMNQEIKEEIGNGQYSPANIVLILPPEHMENVNKMNFLASKYPQIAREIPVITSAEEFEIAKAHLELTKKYNHYLVAAAVCGPTMNDLQGKLIDSSQYTLKGLLTYVETLQGTACNTFRSLEDEKMFSNSAYEAQYNIAQNHLMLLIAIAMTSLKNKASETKAHVQEIQRIKESLSISPQYRKQLQQLILETQESVPALGPLLNPQLQLKAPQSAKQKGGRIEKQRTVNYYQNILCQIPENLLQGTGNFDSYFNVKAKDILKDFLALTVKKIPHEEYIQHAQKLTEDYQSFEKRGIAFQTFLPGGTESPLSEKSTSRELTELYQFFSQRYTMANQNPLQLLQNSIFMFIQANKVEEALTRTEALKALLLEKGPLTENFIASRASVLALNGDSGEWRKILEEKKNKAHAEKAAAHQKQIGQIKDHQEKKKIEQEKVNELKKASQILVSNRNIPKPDKTPEPVLNVTHDSPTSFATETKPEFSLPREKVKTRPPAQELPQQEDSLKSTNTLSSEIAETPRSPKDYPVSGNAFKIYQKIRRGEWKFPRKNLCNLFSNLKCTVDMSQGKGCHGKISLPLNMIVMNEKGLVGVIPEFIQGEIPQPLTLPDWDEKWSGIVPLYMRKSILSALDYLGATDETVHK